MYRSRFLLLMFISLIMGLGAMAYRSHHRMIPGDGPREGEAAPLFTATDTAGKPFSLKSLRGQYVLIEFWASWCGVCYPRNQEIIEMIKSTNEERKHPLPLVVLMVSLDSRKDKWLASIKKQHIEQFIQVCDYGGWDSEIAVLYGVTKLPANFIIDPNGEIKHIDVFDAQMQWAFDKIKDK